MAKIQIKSEELTPFGGIFSIMEQFDSTLSSVIDSILGLRCKSFGYRYSEIIRSLILKWAHAIIVIIDLIYKCSSCPFLMKYISVPMDFHFWAKPRYLDFAFSVRSYGNVSDSTQSIVTSP